MAPGTVILLMLLSAAAALVGFAIFRKKPDDVVDEATADYTEGLNLMLAGKREIALKKFREAVTKDSRNVDAYLKIGDILRELGQIERAINVHRYLMVRSGLNPKQREEIFQSLAKDYQAGEEFDKALEVLDKVIEMNKSALWAQEMKLKLYEQKEEWDNAFETYRDLRKNQSESPNGRLALYKVQEGLQLIGKGKEREARSRFKDAIKIAPNSPPAYIYLADSYRREDRKSDALQVLKEFIEKVPSQSYLAFERVKQLLFEGGVFGEIENLYLELIEIQPNNLMARLALAEIYEKKGELKKAIRTCLDVLEKEPANELAKKHLVRLYHKAGDDQKSVRQALDLIDESLKHKEQFRCKLCGYASEEPFWRCPECREWETFVKN
jgi:lipopolysaccharide biosynthesis regulator YciM